jgi:hypothetical protein
MTTTATSTSMTTTATAKVINHTPRITTTSRTSKIFNT